MDAEARTRLGWIRLYEQVGDAGLVCRRCGISRPTLRKWWRRYQAEGEAGLGARAAATSARSRSAACRLRFFHVQPHRRRARPTVQGWTRTPVRSASRSRHSASVRWFASRSRPSNAASTSPAIRGFGPPPIRLAVRRPSTRASRAQRWAVERPTVNRRAAAPGVAPASTAARTRPRRSAEYDPAIDTSVPPYGHRCPDFLAVRSTTAVSQDILTL